MSEPRDVAVQCDVALLRPDIDDQGSLQRVAIGRGVVCQLL